MKMDCAFTTIMHCLENLPCSFFNSLPTLMPHTSTTTTLSGAVSGQWLWPAGAGHLDGPRADARRAPALRQRSKVGDGGLY